MDSATRVLLERVRHALTTLSGLWVTDQRVPGQEGWRIDERPLIAEIDKALPPGPGPWIEPLSPLTPEQLTAIEAHWKGMLRNLDGMVIDGIRAVVVVPDPIPCVVAEPVAAYGEREQE